MNVFIPTKGRYDIISTHLVFKNAMVVVHNQQEYDLYSNRVDKNRLVVSGVKGDAFGLTRQREWIVNNLVHNDEWFVFADDNIAELQAVPEPHYNERSLLVQQDKSLCKLYTTQCSANRFFAIAVEMISLCESLGVNLCGFATNANPYFRGKKYRTIGYVIGKLMIWKNVGIPFDHTITMEDFYYTAWHLMRYGGVLINNFVYPKAGHYQHGGMGSYQERIPYRKADCKNLMNLFPGLFRYKQRKGFEPNTDLAVRITNAESLCSWRKGMQKEWFVNKPRVLPDIK